MEIIQHTIDTLGAGMYLEIGVFDGRCFCSVNAPTKIGVDPIAPAPAVVAELTKQGVQYFALRSDDFFRTVAPQVLNGGMDVAFIDGLHTCAQAYRDCINCLEYLKPNGLILLHDCLPTSVFEARVAGSLDEANRLNSGAVWNGDWVGDVWKAILKLRSHGGLETCVLNCDHGIGLVYKARNSSGLSLSSEQIDAMTYADLAGNEARLLGVKMPTHVNVVLEKLRFAGAAEQHGGTVSTLAE